MSEPEFRTSAIAALDLVYNYRNKPIFTFSDVVNLSLFESQSFCFYLRVTSVPVSHSQRFNASRLRNTVPEPKMGEDEALNKRPSPLNESAITWINVRCSEGDCRVTELIFTGRLVTSSESTGTAENGEVIVDGNKANHWLTRGTTIWNGKVSTKFYATSHCSLPLVAVFPCVFVADNFHPTNFWVDFTSTVWTTIRRLSNGLSGSSVSPLITTIRLREKKPETGTGLPPKLSGLNIA
ncbi:hypothetical protein C8R45DRAFT_932963 [Mycena sanguinolenta]|nr:hypothetical protein C8R45DRAFT_932963 [Mycena sanguinolenta]